MKHNLNDAAPLQELKHLYASKTCTETFKTYTNLK